MTEPCNQCAHDAVGSLAFIRERDGSEQSRSAPKCAVHLDAALTTWDQMKVNAPEAVAGVKILVVS